MDLQFEVNGSIQVRIPSRTIRVLGTGLKNPSNMGPDRTRPWDGCSLTEAGLGSIRFRARLEFVPAHDARNHVRGLWTLAGRADLERALRGGRRGRRSSACWVAPRGSATDSGHRTAPTRGFVTPIIALVWVFGRESEYLLQPESRDPCRVVMHEGTELRLRPGDHRLGIRGKRCRPPRRGEGLPSR